MPCTSAMVVAVSENVTLWPFATIWSTLISVASQLSGVTWTSNCPMSTSVSMASYSPLPYLTAVPGGAWRWLCADGIWLTALSGIVVTWAPVSTIADTLWMLLIGPVFIRGPRGCGFCLAIPLLPAALEVGVLSVEDSFAFAGSWVLVRLVRLVWTWISDLVPCDFADFLAGLSKSVGDLSDW